MKKIAIAVLVGVTYSIAMAVFYAVAFDADPPGWGTVAAGTVIGYLMGRSYELK